MLHSALVARQSRSLNALVNGGMREASERCADWEEVDEQTFVRFSQFAYTGDYDPAAPVIDSSSRKREEEQRPRSTDSFVIPRSASISPHHQYERRRPADELWENFRTRRYIESHFHLQLQNKEDEDYTEVFLSHAKLFVFANYHGISKLEMLTLHKLRNTLVEFTLHRSRLGDIVPLIRYSYENTAGLNELPAGLRELVAVYAACKAEELWESTDFQELLEECGEIAKDILGQTLKRLD